jgi:hypothetical protein
MRLPRAAGELLVSKKKASVSVMRGSNGKKSKSKGEATVASFEVARASAGGNGKEMGRAMRNEYKDDMYNKTAL